MLYSSEVIIVEINFKVISFVDNGLAIQSSVIIMDHVEDGSKC